MPRPSRAGSDSHRCGSSVPSCRDAASGLGSGCALRTSARSAAVDDRPVVGVRARERTAARIDTPAPLRNAGPWGSPRHLGRTSQRRCWPRHCRDGASFACRNCLGDVRGHAFFLPSDAPCPWPFVANIAGQFGVGEAKIWYPTHTWMWHQMMPNLMLIPEGEIMRTIINIDDELLAKAAKLVGPMDRTGMVSEGSKALIERESARRPARLGGTQPTLKAAPRRRLKRPV